MLAACSQPGLGSSGGSGGSTNGSGGKSASGGSSDTASGGSSGAASGGSSDTGSGGSTGGAGSPGSGGSVIGGAGGATIACAPPVVTLPSGNDAAFATPIQFNDNGGWCWYQDERAVIDTKANKLIIGSVASGGARNGHAEAVIYDLAAKAGKQYTLPSTLAASAVDDHNAPALVIRPDGKYVAMWSGHRVDCISRTSIFDGTAWGAETKFDWTSLGCPWNGDPTAQITYSNLWYMSTESRLYSAVRSISTSPSFLASTTDGQSFSYYGRLSSTPRVGYVAGYYKYWGNGTDRIDFLGTEAHPRDNDNNLWHGYVQGGKIYNSTATAIDTTAADMTGQDITSYTKVFATGTAFPTPAGSVKMSHAWNADLMRYDDGTIAAIWTARANTTTDTNNNDLRLLYARFDGSTWKLTYLGKAGPKLYAAEQDYTGLGALHPDDPHTIYISTTFDPRDDKTNLGKHEIFQGTTCDNGATFTWTPLTARSTVDNLRPIVPKWDASHTALLWLRGTYTTAQIYSQSIVGVISGAISTKP